jgi:hypothetical protein
MEAQAVQAATTAQAAVVEALVTVQAALLAAWVALAVQALLSWWSGEHEPIQHHHDRGHSGGSSG